jgi:hypothetical protein
MKINEQRFASNQAKKHVALKHKKSGTSKNQFEVSVWFLLYTGVLGGLNRFSGTSRLLINLLVEDGVVCWHK